MRISAIFVRILRQFARDKRTLGLMIIAPMFVLFLLSLVFNSDDYVPTVGYGNLPDALVTKLQQQEVKVINVTETKAMELMEKSEIDAYVIVADNSPEIWLEGSDPTANRASITAIQKSFQSVLPNVGPVPEPSITYVHGKEDMNLLDYFGPVFIGFFIFFFVFLIAGVSFLRERTVGTLERLLATPLRRWEIVIGYIFGFGVFTTFQAALISWFTIHILGIIMEGSFWFVLLVTFLLAMTALTLGILLSSFANNELQMMQFIPIIVVPQIFFSGLFNIEGMANWLQSISFIMPLKYGADALREIMIRGQGWETIAIDIYVLLGFSLLFMVLNIIALKKHRKL